MVIAACLSHQAFCFAFVHSNLLARCWSHCLTSIRCFHANDVALGTYFIPHSPFLFKREANCFCELSSIIFLTKAIFSASVFPKSLGKSLNTFGRVKPALVKVTCSRMNAVATSRICSCTRLPSYTTILGDWVVRFERQQCTIGSSEGRESAILFGYNDPLKCAEVPNKPPPGLGWFARRMPI
jgi:hypothetical protein